VFARFVVDPPTDTATLTFKQQPGAAAGAAGAQQQQQAAPDSGAEVVLSGPELQQLQRQLLLVLSGSSAATGSSSSSSSSSGSRAVQLRPISSSSSAPVVSSRARGGAAANGLELLLDGSVAAVLQPVHVVSLVTVFDDLGGQLPQQYSTSRQMQEVQVSPVLFFLFLDVSCVFLGLGAGSFFGVLRLAGLLLLVSCCCQPIWSAGKGSEL
jgi:hypothetical protein